MFSGINEWISSQNRSTVGKAFWLHGSAGTGKSSISSEFIFRSRGNIHILNHFFRYNDTATSSPSGVILSLARQLLSMIPEIFNGIDIAKLREAMSNADKNIEDLFTLLLKEPLDKMCSNSLRIDYRLVIVLDALDEVEERHKIAMLGLISNRLSQLPPFVRLFVTSREDPSIRRSLSLFSPKELLVDESKNLQDMHKYLSVVASEVRLS
jgi:hypothetical protein